MIKINLLKEKISPVRGQTRMPGEASRNLVFAAVVVVTLAGLLFWWYSNNARLGNLEDDLRVAQEEYENLQSIIRQVDEYEKKTESLNQKIQIISDLKKNQTGPVHLLDEVSKALPNLIWLTSMTQKGERINIGGEAITYNAVADFIANLRQSNYIQSPELLNSEEMQGTVVFSLTFLFQQPDMQSDTGDV